MYPIFRDRTDAGRRLAQRVGGWYERFDQTPDEEVREILSRSARAVETHRASGRTARSHGRPGDGRVARDVSDRYLTEKGHWHADT